MKQPTDNLSDAETPSANLSEPFVSYAENGEDVLLWRALHGVEQGFYIDVGAAEPVADSVTNAFYLRGWRGVNLEPNLAAFERLALARPEDTNLNTAAGAYEGRATLYLPDGGNAVSTAFLEQVRSLRARDWSSTEAQAPVRKLSSIVAEYVRGQVHFLRIDAIGGERAVLEGADFRQFRPWLILVRATGLNSQQNNYQEWEHLLIDEAYRFVWFDGLNRFYVATERAELAAALRVQPNVYDRFVRYREVEVRKKLEQLLINFNELKATGRHGVDANRTRAQRQKEEEELHPTEDQTYPKCTDALAVELKRITAERDAWVQELYESNRHAASLSQERQLQAEQIHALKIKVAELRSVFAPFRSITRLIRRRKG